MSLVVVVLDESKANANARLKFDSDYRAVVNSFGKFRVLKNRRGPADPSPNSIYKNYHSSIYDVLEHLADHFSIDLVLTPIPDLFENGGGI